MHGVDEMINVKRSSSDEEEFENQCVYWQKKKHHILQIFEHIIKTTLNFTELPLFTINFFPEFFRGDCLLQALHINSGCIRQRFDLFGFIRCYYLVSVDDRVFEPLTKSIIKERGYKYEQDGNEEKNSERWYELRSFPIPILFCKETRLGYQRNQTPEKLRIKMQVVRDEVTYHVEKIIALYNILLAAILAKFSQDFRTTIQAIFLFAILFMAHANGVDS